MIVRGRPSPWPLLFVKRGAITATIAPRSFVVTLPSVAVAALQGEGDHHLHDGAAPPFR